jgi:hypothetical protein
MMLLTIMVWVYMYVLRVSFIMREKVDPQDLATTREMIDAVPGRISTPSENLANLFELPVLYYAVCIYIYITSQVDGLYLVFAYSYLVLRVLHSIIHCTYNRVMQRFFIYMLSSLALWAIIIRAFAGTVFA